MSPRIPRSHRASERIGAFFRFTLVGAIGFLVEIGVFVAILHWGSSSGLLANLVSISVSASVVFVASRYYTFPNRNRGELRAETMRFAVVYILSLSYGSALFWVAEVSVESLGDLGLTVLKLFIIVSSTLARFVAYQTFVFKQPAR